MGAIELMDGLTGVRPILKLYIRFIIPQYHDQKQILAIRISRHTLIEKIMHILTIKNTTELRN